MVHSVAGLIAKGALTRARPFRAPHHSASMAALTGGGLRAKPGEVSPGAQRRAVPGRTAGVQRPGAGFSLRQPLETGEVMVARANAHVRYPARVQLVAAMNPCRCGLRRPRPRRLRQGAALPAGLPEPRLRPAAGPHRPAGRGAAGHRRRPGPAAARRGHGRGRRPRRRGPRASRPSAPRPAGDGAAAAQRPGRGRLAGRRSPPSTPRPGPCWPAPPKPARLTARGWTRTLRLARTIADLEGAGRRAPRPRRRSADLPPRGTCA